MYFKDDMIKYIHLYNSKRNLWGGYATKRWHLPSLQHRQILARAILVHHADPLGVSQSCRVSMMLECSTGELLTIQLISENNCKRANKNCHTAYISFLLSLPFTFTFITFTFFTKASGNNLGHRLWFCDKCNDVCNTLPYFQLQP